MEGGRWGAASEGVGCVGEGLWGPVGEGLMGMRGGVLSLEGGGKREGVRGREAGPRGGVWARCSALARFSGVADLRGGAGDTGCWG